MDTRFVSKQAFCVQRQLLIGLGCLALGVFGAQGQAQQPRALTNWTVDPLASAADGDAIFASTQLPVGRARMTLMCVRRDKDNHVKAPSTLELQLDLASTKFDVDVQTKSSQYEDHDFCPMPSPTPYNPYNVIPVPCNYRTETRYSTERTIHVRERTGRNQTQPLEIDAPDARVTNLEFYRDIDFLSAESIMYGFSAGGAEHIIQFSTHTPMIKSFVDRCSSPSEEQSRLIKEIADRKAAAEVAEAARQEQARLSRERATEEARIAAEKAAAEKAAQLAAKKRRRSDVLATASTLSPSGANEASVSSILMRRRLVPLVDLGADGTARGVTNIKNGKIVTYPLTTVIYPDGHETFRVEAMLIPMDAAKYTVFKKDSVFQINKVECKGDYLQLSMYDPNFGAPIAKARIMLGKNWQSTMSNEDVIRAVEKSFYLDW